MTVANVINALLLIIFYFVGIGTTALIAKLFGKKFLDMKGSGWEKLNLKKQKKEDYLRQF